MTDTLTARRPADVGQQAVALTRALVRCPSVTPEEGGALSLLEGVLGAAGFDVERLTFSAAGTPDVQNLYARFGVRRPCLVFAGHTDVVPPGDEAAWRFGPFDAVTEDGVLHGRGVVDMKGGVGASVAAAVDFVRRNPAFDGSIAFLITGDEEGPAVNGTVKLLQWAREQGETFDHCILGEPTNPERLGEMIKIGRRGSLTARLTVHGVQGHVAYPHRAQNPIPALLRYVQALLATPLDSGNERFEPSSLEVTSVDVGNTAANIIPAGARATFNIRFNDIWTPETLKAEVRRRLDAVAGDGPRFTLSFDPCNAVAFVTRAGPFVELMAAAISAETGMRPELSTSGGTSDARSIKDYCPVVEFGLVGAAMHQVNERTPVADVEALARIYSRMIGAYFAAAASGRLK